MPLDRWNFAQRGRLAGSPVPAAGRRPVSIWLFSVAGMLLVMIVLGGATRLTGSGLSIMEWAPLTGALPPLSDTEWRRLFALYQRIPQYTLVNAGLDIEGFKQLFWLEWVHRAWGRLTGVAVFVPLLWFWAKGWLVPRLRSRLLLIFALGALQGAVGWFMVASGFMPESVSVSPYRLVVHLMLAVLIYGTIFWTALDSVKPPSRETAARLPARGLAGACCACVALTMCAGGFVAGLHAGLLYNTFPLMDGRLVPDGYAQLHPFLRNLTENTAAVQFDHRLLATVTLGVALVTSAACLWAGPTSRARAWAAALGVAAVLQFALGVLTLLYVVPVPLGVAHQAGAVLLLTAALGCLHGIGPSTLSEAAPSDRPGWDRDRGRVIAR